MINNDQIAVVLNCCDDIKSQRSGGDAVSDDNLDQLSHLPTKHQYIHQKYSDQLEQW